MIQSFNCPNCGASLAFSGAEHAMRCTFCNTTVAVPEELWRPAEEAQAQADLQKNEKRWLKYLWIFLGITVGLPLCLGLVGTVLGLAGSILGITVPFILPRLIH
ncbi:MAG TPA: hypothetical protein VMC09_07840 [Anaerolineales bacterium]|nr:hypothetical protein [Anaerolineales bacterium]